MPEFSIIVPVYKVEKYLSRCIKSILLQEFGNFELILVDDGSPDSCGKICDEFAKNDARISVIHKDNGGVSSARNCGLKQACGKYICFVDSDDIIAKNTLQRVKESIDQFDPDMVIFDYTVIDSNATDITDSTIENIESIVVGKKQAFDLCADFNRTVRMGIWNKIYRKECIAAIAFDEKKVMAEDIEFLMKSLVRSDVITYIHAGLYGYYIQREDSAMFARHSLNWYRSQFENVKESMQILTAADASFATAASAYACVNGGLSCANGMAICNSFDVETVKDIKEYLKEHLKDVRKSNLSFSKKAQIVLFVIAPHIYYTLMKRKFGR